MFIDFFDENEVIISLKDAAEMLPKRRGGKCVNVSTLYRWTTIGCRGAVLASIQIGGTRCTSKQALQQFFEQLTAGCQPRPCQPRLSSRRDRRRLQAERRLDDVGV